jgi:hypothetical protein
MDLATWWRRHLSERREPPFLLNAALLKEAAGLYHRLPGGRLAESVERAERVCRGEFSFLGTAFSVAGSVPWHQDPQTRQNWPVSFYADIRIPFCDGKGSRNAAGDVKYVWELNRHEFLVDCAKAFYLTGRPRYAERVLELISSWSCANPYLHGVNWAGPLEVAVRALS